MSLLPRSQQRVSNNSLNFVKSQKRNCSSNRMVQFALNNEKLREWGKTKETPAFYYFCLGGNKTFWYFLPTD